MSGIFRNIVFCSWILVAFPAAAEPSRSFGDNPFGVMLWPTANENVELLLAQARGLGVAWYRPPTVYADRWPASSSCSMCSLYARSGLRLALTVRNTDRGPRHLSIPPTDFSSYRATIASILDTWKPALLVVESQENNPESFSDTSPGFSSYGWELDSACAEAHRRGILCTNGGLSDQTAAAATWLDLLSLGQAEHACDFAHRALPDAETLCSYRTVNAVPSDLKAKLLNRIDVLLELYRRIGIDAVNIHYINRDPRVLSETAAYIATTTGKPVLSNQMGLPRDTDTKMVRPLLRAAFAIPLKVAIWFSLDTLETQSLFEKDGRLRESGWEFQRQLSGRK